jgi:hypothetical protein
MVEDTAKKPKLVQPDNPPSEQAPLNPFDPERLRISLDHTDGVGVKKIINTIPVRKPDKQDYIRVHTDETFRLAVAVIDLRADRETFLVVPDIVRDIPGEYAMVTIFTCITRAGVVFLWPVRLPSSDGRQSDWARSEAEAAEMAMQRWVRVKANTNLGAYEVFEATGTIPDPEWPDLTFSQMLTIAFKGRLVDSYSHPVLKRLRGEV